MLGLLPTPGLLQGLDGMRNQAGQGQSMGGLQEVTLGGPLNSWAGFTLMYELRFGGASLPVSPESLYSLKGVHKSYKCQNEHFLWSMALRPCSWAWGPRFVIQINQVAEAGGFLGLGHQPV